MSSSIAFTEFAEAGLRRALVGDPRLEAIKRSIAYRALYMVAKVGRICPAFHDRRMYVDVPSAGSFDVRVLVELKDDSATIWSVARVERDRDEAFDL
jgi:hypothetical protein